MVRVGVVVGAFVIAAASASAPKKREFQSSFEHRAEFDRVWSAALEALADEGFGVASTVKDSGLITSDWIFLRDPLRYADCGSEPNLMSLDSVQARVNVRVQAGASTTVTIKATLEGRMSNAESQKVVPCESLGKLESQLNRQIAMLGERATKAPVMAPATTPRGHFCAANATTAVCAREKSDCEGGRNAALAAVRDLGTCTLVESVYCFGDGVPRCSTTLDMCKAQSGELPCVERR